MTQERPDAVTLKGNPLTLLGPQLRVGDRAPDFKAVDNKLQTVTLSETSGSVRVFSVVPSLDTPVCDVMTRRFNKEAAQLSDVRIYTISMDLPFAQSRWCADSEADCLIMLSDHRDGSFGKHYGTLVKELRLNSRAIFVIDQDDVIRHVEYVKEFAHQPDYDAVLAAVAALSD